MKNRTIILLALAFSIIIAPAFSQTYQVEVKSRPYNDLVGGQNLVTAPWEGLEFEVPLGFSLALFKDTIQSLHSLENFAGGFMISDLNLEATNVILAFSPDLIDRGYELDTFLSPITYTTAGTPGNQTFTLEFENAGFYYGEIQDTLYTDFINYQLIIYEASGDIEMHIGPYSIANPGLDFEGLDGPSIGLVEDFDFVNEGINGEICLVAGDPLDPEILTTIELQETLIWPIPENTVYRFYRGTTKVKDLDTAEKLSYFTPNPTSGNIWLQDQFDGKIVGPVTVINATGKIVTTDTDPEVIEMDGMPTGLYQLYFKTTKGFAMQRISLISY